MRGITMRLGRCRGTSCGFSSGMAEEKTKKISWNRNSTHETTRGQRSRGRKRGHAQQVRKHQKVYLCFLFTLSINNLHSKPFPALHNGNKGGVPRWVNAQNVSAACWRAACLGGVGEEVLGGHSL